MSARNPVRGRGGAEDVGAVAHAADQRLVRRGKLGSERGAEPPAEPPRGRGREVGPGAPKRRLGHVEVVLVHHERLLVDAIGDAPRDPRHVDRRIVRGRLARAAHAFRRPVCSASQRRRRSATAPGSASRPAAAARASSVRRGAPRASYRSGIRGSGTREQGVRGHLDHARSGRGFLMRGYQGARLDDEDDVGLLEVGGRHRSLRAAGGPPGKFM